MMMRVVVVVWHKQWQRCDAGKTRRRRRQTHTATGAETETAPDTDSVLQCQYMSLERP